MRHRTAIKRLPPLWIDAGTQPDNRINDLRLRFRFHPQSQYESDVTLLTWLQLFQKGRGLMKGGIEPPDLKETGFLGMINFSKSNRSFGPVNKSLFNAGRDVLGGGDFPALG